MPRATEEPEPAARVRGVLLGWWQHLSTVDGTDGGGRADTDAPMAVADGLPSMAEVVTATGDVFDCPDQDGDGFHSRREFASLRTRFWISDDPAEPAT